MIQGAAEKDVGAVAYAQGERPVLGQYRMATRCPSGLPAGIPLEAFAEHPARGSVELSRSLVGVPERRSAEARSAGAV